MRAQGRQRVVSRFAPGRTPRRHREGQSAALFQFITRDGRAVKRRKLRCIRSVTFQVATSASLPTFSKECRYAYRHGRRDARSTLPTAGRRRRGGWGGGRRGSAVAGTAGPLAG